MTTELISRTLGALPAGSGKSVIARKLYERRLVAAETRVCTLRSGARVALDLGIQQEAISYLTRDWEGPTWRYLAKSMRPGDTLLDVGANIGLVLLQVCARLQVDVHAFEPSASTAERLRRNVELNPSAKVVVTEAAVSNRSGYLTIEGDNPMTRHVSGSGEGVSAITLDDYVSEHRLAVSAIKIDVEGYEPAVIQGATDLLGSQHPVIVLELNDDLLEIHGFTREDVTNPLSDLGYEPRPLPAAMLQRLRGASARTNDVAFVARPNVPTVST